MHFETYAKIIDEIKDYCIWLTLYSWGEPFLNKQIDRFVAYANKANVATIISSNLNKPLTPQMAESLVKSGLDTLIVSLDGTTQEVYEVYRVGGHLDRVLDNIRLLVEKKKELGYKTPFIEWQFIVMRQNEHQIPEAREMAGDLGVDNIVFKKVDFPHGEDDTEVARRWQPVGNMDYQREQPFDRTLRERCHSAGAQSQSTISIASRIGGPLYQLQPFIPLRFRPHRDPQPARFDDQYAVFHASRIANPVQVYWSSEF